MISSVRIAEAVKRAVVAQLQSEVAAEDTRGAGARRRKGDAEREGCAISPGLHAPSAASDLRNICSRISNRATTYYVCSKQEFHFTL